MINGISASQLGLTRAIQRLDATAQNIAHQATAADQPAIPSAPASTANSGIPLSSLDSLHSPAPSAPDPAVDQVNLLLSKRHFEANLNAIRAQDDVLATLLSVVDQK
jgi:flagellar basal body rod protein FlgC